MIPSPASGDVIRPDLFLQRGRELMFQLVILTVVVYWVIAIWRGAIVAQAHRCRRMVGVPPLVDAVEPATIQSTTVERATAQPAPVDLAAADLPAAEPVAPTTLVACAQQRVLLIDDEPVLRIALRRYFQRRQWEVEEADDGAAALRMLEASPPGHYGAVLTDLKMPRVSGVEVHDFLARRRPDLQARLIIMTGDAASPAATEFISRAGCPVLEKPFELAMLARTIEGLQHQAAAVASG